jgi:hypothetical protein
MTILTVLGLALSAHAADPAVEITSFYYTNQLPDHTAEICGRVTGDFSGSCRVVVTIDPGNQAGTYVAWPGKDGHWCALVNSYTGHATAAMWHGDTHSSESAATAVVAAVRAPRN